MTLIALFVTAVTNLEQKYVPSVTPHYTAIGETNVGCTDWNVFTCTNNVWLSLCRISENSEPLNTLWWTAFPPNRMKNVVHIGKLSITPSRKLWLFLKLFSHNFQTLKHILWRSPAPNFSQNFRQIWTVRAEIHLLTSVKYSTTVAANFHETRVYSIIF